MGFFLHALLFCAAVSLLSIGGNAFVGLSTNKPPTCCCTQSISSMSLPHRIILVLRLAWHSLSVFFFWGPHDLIITRKDTPAARTAVLATCVLAAFTLVPVVIGLLPSKVLSAQWRREAQNICLDWMSKMQAPAIGNLALEPHMTWPGLGVAGKGELVCVPAGIGALSAGVGAGVIAIVATLVAEWVRTWLGVKRRGYEGPDEKRDEMDEKKLLEMSEEKA